MKSPRLTPAHAYSDVQESLPTFFADKSLDSNVRPPTQGRDGVGSDGGRHDERFGIVHDERREFFIRALDQAGLPANKVEYIDGSARVVRNGCVKPVAACFDELQRVQPCTLLAPAFAIGHGHHGVDEFSLGPLCVALPGDIGKAVIDVDRTRLAVEPQPTPVPEFEGVNVGGGADLQHDDARAGTVDCPTWNEEVIVSPDRPLVDIGFSWKRRASQELSSPKIGDHGFSIDAGFQAEVYGGIGSGSEYIIALVLRIRDAEFIADIVAARMHL